MGNPQRWRNDELKISFIPKMSQVFFTGGHSQSRYKIFGRGGDGSNRLVLLCLGLLNIFLLIVAVVIGINCTKVKEGSLHVSHSAVTQLINKLDYLRSNHSDVIEAEEKVKNELDQALKSHTQLKEKIEQQKTINDNYQKQIDELQTEKTNLKSNISTLEGSCGRCPRRWILFNSSCYFFSYTESSTAKKNWQDSRANCNTRGADLVVIDNKEEQKFVSDTTDNMRDSNSYEWENAFWVGLRDTEIEGTWVWINNVTEVEQRYWMDGEPNDAGHHGEDCVTVHYRAKNPWKTRNDVNCQTVKRFWICEMTSS